MNYIKDKTVGIDVQIQLLQNSLYSYLKTALGIVDNDYNCYGRVYRNNTSGGIAPFYYSGGKQYGSGDLFYNDRVKIQSFFDVATPIKVDKETGKNTAKVMLLFFADLSALYGDNTRDDEELRNMIVNYVEGKYTFRVTAIHIGAKDVLSEFNGALKNDQLGKDMQPRHFFRIDMELPHYDTRLINC